MAVCIPLIPHQPFSLPISLPVIVGVIVVVNQSFTIKLSSNSSKAHGGKPLIFVWFALCGVVSGPFGRVLFSAIAAVKGKQSRRHAIPQLIRTHAAIHASHDSDEIRFKYMLFIQNDSCRTKGVALLILYEQRA